MQNLRFAYEFFEKCLRFSSFHIEVFHPYNNIKIVWDITHFLIILILMFLIPIDLCFNVEIEKKVKTFLEIFFFFDFIMNMNTSYFQKGFIVKKRKPIIHNYLKTDFLYDLISLIFYLIELKDYGHCILLKFLFFLRWKTLSKINTKLQAKFKLWKVHSSVLELVNLLFFSFYILNVFACFWYYIAFINSNSTDSGSKTWLEINNLANEKLYKQYLYSLYWSTVTVLTVGYGDIVAKNNIEITYSIFTIFFGCGLFAYFINAVGVIVQEINKEAHSFK